MDSADLVYRTLKESSKPLKAGEIIAATGLAKNEIDKAMKLLKDSGRIFSPKRCFWDAK